MSSIFCVTILHDTCFLREALVEAPPENYYNNYNRFSKFSPTQNYFWFSYDWLECNSMEIQWLLKFQSTSNVLRLNKDNIQIYRGVLVRPLGFEFILLSLYFHIISFLLALFFFLFNSCCCYVQVLGTILVHEFGIFHCHTE